MDRRSLIVDAALASSAEVGWQATSLQSVRERAGVSNGTLFHYFPTRDELTAAVVSAGLVNHQDALLDELHAATTTHAGVVGVVVRHLNWVEANPHLAHLLLSTSPKLLRTGIDPSAVDSNRRFFDEIGDWLSRAGWTEKPDLAVVVSIWIGAAQEYARGWLADPQASLANAAPTLAGAAWHGLKPLLEART